MGCAESSAIDRQAYNELQRPNKVPSTCSSEQQGQSSNLIVQQKNNRNSRLSLGAGAINLANNNVSQPQPNKKPLFQQQHFKIVNRKNAKKRLTQQEIQYAYNFVQGDYQKLFDELSQRISQYYMDLTVEAIDLMSQNKFTSVQTKVYLSEQFLLTTLAILKVIGKKSGYKYQANLFQTFKKAQGMLINYLYTKYPRTNSIFVSSQLSKQFTSFDRLQSPENDILRNAGICFTDSSYQGVIKKLKIFINTLLDELDKKYPIFHNLMHDKVFSYEDQSKKIKTFNYKIGRKLPQSTPRYQLDETDQFTIQSPQLFRVIIKWVQDIEKYLTSEQYIDNKQVYKVYKQRNDKDKDNNNNNNKDNIIFDEVTYDEYQDLDDTLRNKIKQIKIPYKESIQGLVKQMDMFNLNLIKILCTTQRKQKYVPKNQVMVIKYAMYNTQVVVWLLAQKLINILKKLINIGKQMQNTEIGSKLDLINFNVADLFRSMIMGTKNQLLIVYHNLKKLEQSGEIKIIRIKNRLGTALNDVMVIFKLKQSFIICELQLILTEGQGISDKAKALQTMNHFLYQLVRSPYGVLSQISVVLGYKDNKIQYQNKITFENKSFTGFKNCEKQHPTSIQTIKLQKTPFICTQCTQYYNPFENIFGFKRCQKCFIFQCCKCIFNKSKDLDKQLYQRFSEQLVMQIAGEKNRTKKPYFNSLSKQIKIQQILKYFFFEQKVFLKSLIPDQYQILKPKDIHNYIKRKQFNIEELKNAKSPLFLLVQFKGGKTYIKSYFWNPAIQQIQNSYNQKQNFYHPERINLSSYDFIIFFNTNNTETQQISAIQKKIKLCIKPESNRNGVKSFDVVKVSTKDNLSLAYLVYRFEFSKNTQIDGKKFDEQQVSAKKQFTYSSIKEARKNLPKVATTSQFFEMNNQGILSSHLTYFKECPIQQLKKIKTINLSDNKITDISIILEKCVCLQSLILAKNFISKIKIEKQSMKNLRKLVLANNRLETIKGLNELKNLHKLNLKNNHLSTLQNLKLEHLNEFIISKNNFKQLDWLQNSQLFQLQLFFAEDCGIDTNGVMSNDKQYVFNLPQLKKFMFEDNLAYQLKLQSPELCYLNCSNCSLASLKLNSHRIEYLNIQNNNRLQNLEQIISIGSSSLKKVFAKKATSKLQHLPIINSEFLQILDLEQCGIANVDNLQFSNLPKLVNFNLSKNSFLKFPKLYLPNVQNFVINQVKLQDISGMYNSQITALRQLKIQGNENISSNCQAIKFPNLKTLIFKHFNFETMAQFGASELPNLENLYLSNLQINDFPKLSLNNLKTFSLNEVTIKNMKGLEESSFINLQKIVIIKLNQFQQDQKQSLNKINAPNLKYLQLSQSKNINISNFLIEFPQVQKINIKNCKCEVLPILNFTKLIQLQITQMKLTNIQNLALSKIQILEKLDLYDNQIVVLPKFNLNKLKILNVGKNKLIDLNGFSESKLPHLQNFGLSQNMLQQFPILQLEKLKYLNISKNPFKDLNGLSKCKLPKLEFFCLQNCDKLTQSIFPNVNLPNVKKIQLKKCNFKDLSNFQNSFLPKIEKIILQQLQIKSLPAIQMPKVTQFTYLTSMNNIWLEDISNMNKWKCPNLQKIKIKNQKFVEIPILNFPKLNILNLSENNLKDASKLELSILPQLKQIDFSKNSDLKTTNVLQNNFALQTISYNGCQLNEVKNMPSVKLKSIDLGNCGTKQIAKINLSQTQQLIIENNQIEDLTSFLTQAPKLENLDFSGNKIAKLPDIIFTFLQKIDAKDNKIIEINLSAKNFPSLIDADFSNNQIENIIQISCPYLQTINLTNNKLTKITCFSKDSTLQLQNLILSNNQIQQIQSIPSCQILNLNNNKLKNLNFLPNCNLKLCKQLSCQNNLIEDASGISHSNTILNMLQIFNLAYNKLESFPFQNNYPSLIHLNISNNEIQTINNITDQYLPTLQRIQLNNNNISTFGPKVQVSKLRKLNLNKNKLQNILGYKLKDLCELQLCNNKFKSLKFLQSNKINCFQLEILKLNNNPITSLSSLNKFRNLKRLQLQNTIIMNIEQFTKKPHVNKQSIEIIYTLQKQLANQKKICLRKQMMNIFPQSVCQNYEIIDPTPKQILSVQNVKN